MNGWRLNGPAGIGWIAQASSLPLAFVLLGAALVVAAAASARRVGPGR